MSTSFPFWAYSAFSLLLASIAYSSTLKTEKTHSFETLENFQQTTWCQIQDDRTLPEQHGSPNVFDCPYMTREIN
jgi:hypothetical protein